MSNENRSTLGVYRIVCELAALTRSVRTLLQEAPEARETLDAALLQARTDHEALAPGHPDFAISKYYILVLETLLSGTENVA